MPFRSYLQPLIVMGAIPFGIIGVIGGHLLMGKVLTVMSVFGIVALSGVVVRGLVSPAGGCPSRSVRLTPVEICYRSPEIGPPKGGLGHATAETPNLVLPEVAARL